MKGRALRRAMQADPLRVNAGIPLIVDTTELIGPDEAKMMLSRNRSNRPINWRKVEEYAEKMRAGLWRLHSQGIILDTDGNIITGQKRLWAIVKSGIAVYIRVSRGNPKECAELVDRGTPQSARDLAARRTGRTHSPVEASIGRAMLVLNGNLRPSADDLAGIIQRHSEAMSIAIAGSRGSRKTRGALMVIAALIDRFGATIETRLPHVPIYADKLQAGLAPRTAEECWGKGVAFSLAMECAKRIVGAS